MLYIPSAMTRPRPAAESCFMPEKLEEIVAVLAGIFAAADARAQVEADDAELLAAKGSAWPCHACLVTARLSAPARPSGAYRVGSVNASSWSPALVCLQYGYQAGKQRGSDKRPPLCVG
jgi:hypothetical protein